MRAHTGSHWRPEISRATLSHRNAHLILIVVSTALVSSAALLYATKWGIGASPDSAAYIQTARHLLAGHSLLTLADTHQPPFYPLSLALVGSIGTDPLVAARWLHALLIAANVSFLGLVLSKVTNRFSLLVPALILFAMAAPILEIHTFAWSEPLFILLGLTGLVFTASFLSSGKIQHYLLAALLLGLACLTRYAGIPFIVSASLGILLLAQAPWRRRLLAAALFALLGALPLLAWAARNFFVAGATTSRQLAFHPVGASHFWQLFYTVSAWLQIPEAFPNLIRFSLWLCIIVAVLITALKRRSQQAPQGRTSLLIKLLALFIAVYLFFILFSISFFDANTPLDNRILSPIVVAALPIALSLYEKSVELAGARRFRQMLVLSPLFLLCALTALQSVSNLARQQQAGLGYNSPTWHNSELLAEIENVPENVVIFSNAPEAIILLQNRDSRALPRKQDAMSATANAGYRQEVDDVIAAVNQQSAVVFYFHALAQRPVTSDVELREQYSLEPLSTTIDGVILGVRPLMQP